MAEKIKLVNYPIGPFPTALAGVQIDDQPNYVTIGACGVVCQEPVLYMSLKETHYSTRGVKETGSFSLNIPSADLVQKTDYCGVVSGKDTDKSRVFTPFYDGRGQAPMIRECPLNFLCKVVQSIPVFGFEMFLGEIVAVYIDNQCLTEGKPDPQKINPMLMMGTHYYSLGSVVGAIYQEGMVYKKSLSQCLIVVSICPPPSTSLTSFHPGNEHKADVSRASSWNKKAFILYMIVLAPWPDDCTSDLRLLFACSVIALVDSALVPVRRRVSILIALVYHGMGFAPWIGLDVWNKYCEHNYQDVFKLTRQNAAATDFQRSWQMSKSNGRAKDAIAVLKQDHRNVRELLEKLESARLRPSKTRDSILSTIEKEMKIHSRIEEEIFYPAYRDSVRKKGDQSLYFESLEEHHLVDTVMDECHQQQSNESFAAKCKVLKDLIEHHVSEEERDLFPIAKKNLSSSMLQDLGQQMEERKMQLASASENQ
jgi:flavin reductase (DIM6/NTAB) family NADH-FMN oxidoreductase RutF/hemerythrin-like domain-containing protein